jgi:hypothetical protein
MIPPKHDRTLCRGCRGTGRIVTREGIKGRCLICDGGGRVCPRCRGQRSVKSLVPLTYGESRICPTCCEGNQVNPVRECRAIRHYLQASETRIGA